MIERMSHRCLVANRQDELDELLRGATVGCSASEASDFGLFTA